MGEPAIRVESLTRDERLELLERIWLSLTRYPANLPVGPAQAADLVRRAADVERDVAHGQAPGVPWDEVLRQVRSRR